MVDFEVVFGTLETGYLGEKKVVGGFRGLRSFRWCLCFSRVSAAFAVSTVFISVFGFRGFHRFRGFTGFVVFTVSKFSRV